MVSMTRMEKLKSKQIKLGLKPWITAEIQKLPKVTDNLFQGQKGNL